MVFLLPHGISDLRHGLSVFCGSGHAQNRLKHCTGSLHPSFPNREINTVVFAACSSVFNFLLHVLKLNMSKLKALASKTIFLLRQNQETHLYLNSPLFMTVLNIFVLVVCVCMHMCVSMCMCTCLQKVKYSRIGKQLMTICCPECFPNIITRKFFSTITGSQIINSLVHYFTQKT